MGRIAAENADRVIVTDDNPRSENPAAIRAAILAEAPGAVEIGDRAEAIRRASSGSGELAMCCWLRARAMKWDRLLASASCPFRTMKR